MHLSRIVRMVVRHNASGWDEFVKLAESLEGKGEPVHVFFKGDKDEKGDSWCPYCVKAAPVVEEALKLAPENSHFITVVIDRPFWKDLNNPFRKDPRTHLVFLPTLLRWKSPQRLDGEQVSNKDLVEMLLSDED
ncbi:AAEL012116-PA [Aedes aegypti]|uniref:Thioredoxin domain-containing protein 17 n=3 Tax=Stegomyia TaxID=53541 RepID=Q16HD2_AEDAE|nr:thioredoxin domain-containing protein 17 [Aedes aegypti]XP_029727300.1 thioredoxin domain-containing protein 17 [Aedes albopictus]EAT33643.1 AAEL014064-PA [Aedes aegypti]EAT35737.1 AAEL012116-PA [Aedes aegypti]